MLNVIKKIVFKLRSLFKKEENVSVSEIQKKYLEIGANFGNIGFVSNKQPGKNQKDLFARIQPGDLVFCRMPFSDQTVNAVPEGHRSRPYLIVQKSEEELYGYACSTHPIKLKPHEKHVFVNRVYDEENHKYKDSCVQFNQAFIIPASHILKFYEELDEFTIHQIARELQVYKNIRKKDILQFSKEICFCVGDIVLVENTYYYLKEMNRNKYIMYPFGKEGTKVDTSMFKMNMPTHIDIQNPIVFENLSIDHLIRLSNAKFNEIVRRLEKESKPKKVTNKQYTYRYSIGEILEHKITHEKIIYLFDYAKESFGLNYENYLLRMYKLQQINLNVYLDTSSCLDEIHLVYAYKSFLKQNIGHKSYFEERLEIENMEHPYPYKLDYQIGSILQDQFSEEEYIYLYSFENRKFGLLMSKKKKFIEITSKHLVKLDDIVENKMIEFLNQAIEQNSGRIKSTLEKLLDEYKPCFDEVHYEVKYPVGTILKYVYRDDEYMYLFSLEHHDFGIQLDDASNEIYDFSTIDLDMMNENGELVEEDVKFILDGILKDVIRYKLKSAIESIQMVLE